MPEKMNESIISNWLVDNIVNITSLSKEKIKLDIPIASYGLDSLQSVTLTGELEDWLKVEVDPTLFWDNPTINYVSKHIYTLLN